MLSDLTVSDRRAPGCEKKSLEMAVQQNLVPFDYEQKKLLATKAIQTKPATNDYRVPTSAWSGYGLSQTIPPMSATDLNKVYQFFSIQGELLYSFFLFKKKKFVGIDHDISSVRFVEGADCVGVQQGHRLWNRFRQRSCWPDRDKFQLLGAHAQRSPQEYHVQSVRRLDQHADFRWIGKVHSYVYVHTHFDLWLLLVDRSHAFIILAANLKFYHSLHFVFVFFIVMRFSTFFENLKPRNLASFWGRL